MDVTVRASERTTPASVASHYATGVEVPYGYTVRDITPLGMAEVLGATLGQYRVIQYQSYYGRPCECICFRMWTAYRGRRYSIGTVDYVRLLD